MDLERKDSLNAAIEEDCDGKKEFWVFYGPIIKNVPTLIGALKRMNDYTFKYHVNADNNKNDFADWIRTTLGFRKLAMKLEGTLSKQEYINILESVVKNSRNLKEEEEEEEIKFQKVNKKTKAKK